jgi:hypothetical protein
MHAFSAIHLLQSDVSHRVAVVVELQYSTQAVQLPAIDANMAEDFAGVCN